MWCVHFYFNNSLYLYLYLFVSPSLCPSVPLSLPLSLCLSLCLSTCPSVCVSTCHCLPVYLPLVCLPVPCLCIHPSVHPSFSAIHISVLLPICPSTYLSFSLPIRLSLSVCPASVVILSALSAGLTFCMPVCPVACRSDLLPGCPTFCLPLPDLLPACH